MAPPSDRPVSTVAQMTPGTPMRRWTTKYMLRLNWISSLATLSVTNATGFSSTRRYWNGMKNNEVVSSDTANSAI